MLYSLLHICHFRLMRARIRKERAFINMHYALILTIAIKNQCIIFRVKRVSNTLAFEWHTGFYGSQNRWQICIFISLNWSSDVWFVSEISSAPKVALNWHTVESRKVKRSLEEEGVTLIRKRRLSVSMFTDREVQAASLLHLWFYNFLLI